MIIIKGINKENIIKLSKIRKEPKFILDFRLNALETFKKMKFPK